MGDLVLFSPRSELNAIDNLDVFVDMCRNQLKVFGDSLDWDKNEWDISQFIEVRGRRGRLALLFSNYESAGAKKITSPLAPAYLDFAKAYMRYQHGMRPTKDFNKRMAALRVLEKTLRECSLDGIPRVETVNGDILTKAATTIATDLPSSAYHIGNQLEILAAFLADNRLVTNPYTWRNPNRKNLDVNIRVGDEAEKRRSAKLPTAESIDALAKAYREATATQDVIITSIAALLVCSPDRINEIFRLPVLCEHDGIYEGRESFGLRWWPSKGAEPYIKWMPKTVTDLAKEAIGKLKEHTEEARAIARWYEENPKKLFLPKGCEHLRSRPLITDCELANIIGLADQKSTQAWARQRNIAMQKCGGKRMFSFDEIEQVIVAMLPADSPFSDKKVKLKYSETLILVQKNTFNPRKAAYRCMFETITTDTFNNQLGAGDKHGKSSIFSRMGVKDSRSEIHKVTSHQFRHWLNTLAQNAGLSQLHIAKWSGRKDIQQNSDYDHLTGSELIAKAQALSRGKMFGPIADFVMSAPISKEEFLKLAFPTAHVTEYGYCIHDWTMTPCTKYRDCLLCTDHLCVKGNMRTESLRDLLSQTEELHARAKAAAQEGFFGADRWLEHHAKKLAILKGHLNILDDPEIPEESIYQLSGIREYSPTAQAIEVRMTHNDPDAAALRKVMERLHSLGYHQSPLDTLQCRCDKE